MLEEGIAAKVAARLIVLLLLCTCFLSTGCLVLAFMAFISLKVLVLGELILNKLVVTNVLDHLQDLLLLQGCGF